MEKDFFFILLKINPSKKLTNKLIIKGSPSLNKFEFFQFLSLNFFKSQPNAQITQNPLFFL